MGADIGPDPAWLQVCAAQCRGEIEWCARDHGMTGYIHVTSEDFMFGIQQHISAKIQVSTCLSPLLEDISKYNV